MRVRDEVVVPGRVLRGAALGRDQRVGALVLDAHQRVLAELAALRARRRSRRRRDAAHRRALGAAGGLVGLDLVAHPLLGAGLVLATECHAPLTARVVGRSISPAASRPDDSAEDVA